MSRPVKYSPVMKAAIIDLYGQGYSVSTIASMCDVSIRTLWSWIKKYNLRELMDDKRLETAKECIEVGLRKLASGSQELIEEETFLEYRRYRKTIKCEETGEFIDQEGVQPITKTIKRKVKPPEVKALEVLARKYYKEFDSKSEEREVITKVLEGFTMRELQEARKTNPIDQGKYIDAEFQELSKDNA